MSGFEIAGAVLGAIPLIISALEHYADGVSTMKNMKEYEYVFADIHCSFTASVGIYIDSCYMLLNPLNLPDNQIKTLLEERKEVAWKDPELRKGLEKQLGANCKIYLSLVNKLNRRILMFSKKLKLRTDLKPQWIAADGTVDEKACKKFFNNTWTRIKGGFDSAKYTTLLEEIDRDIYKISKLTSSAIKLEPIRAAKMNRRNSTYWRNIRDKAQRLFESFSLQFCPCSCQHPHQANLRLDIRKDYDADEDTVRFAFLFTFQKDAYTHTSLPWDWRDVEIETLQTPNTSVTLVTSTQSSITKTAHFAPSITVSRSSSVSNTSRAPPSSASKIDDFCKTLMQGAHSKCCLGFLEDQLWQHHVYSVQGPGEQNQIKEAASLQEVLCERSKSFLATREKCTLALTLASAVLQLHDTHWLRKDWDISDIYFLKNSEGISFADHLYVSRTFASPATLQYASSKHRRCVKNEIVFALGVALLELSWGQPLLTYKTLSDLNDLGQEDSMTEFSIAMRLADEIHLRELPNYAKVAARCIRCNFDTFTCNFEDEEFRERFYEGVIVPLQEDYEYATGASVGLATRKKTSNLGLGGMEIARVPH